MLRALYVGQALQIQVDAVISTAGLVMAVHQEVEYPL